MKKEDLCQFKGTKCVIWVDVKQPKPFHYRGIVLDISDSLFTLLDDKTGTRMSFSLDSICNITELGHQ